ncbi:hypothetical protein [Paracoccus alkanivorans]|uniref:DUF2188 domain-containing protein n=1 Tax=Paracoccus alkanivorans TaxID=2116655 RepID=A0A3M0MKH9_9RHOB|nr:hypothetical protein [Paracoccus alkanivorans]RMC37573.1 hypothetical protein C9E81_02140 [Paracoccus alkanivorans]
MSDEAKSEMVLEVAPNGAEPTQWMVFWADGKPVSSADDLIFESRDDASANDRAVATKGPVRIIVHEGQGHAEEEWAEEEWKPFYQRDESEATRQG